MGTPVKNETNYDTVFGKMVLDHGLCTDEELRRSLEELEARRKINPVILKDLMIERAEAAQIPYQLEILRGGTTDAYAIQLTRAGVPSGCLSIPCRHFHTPSEMVDLRDVENAVKLLVEILRQPIDLGLEV